MTEGAVAAEVVPARRRRRRTPKRVAAQALLHALVVVLAAIFVAPIVWGFLNSLREAHQGVSGPAIPHPAHWDNYRFAWSGLFPFSHYLWNTVVLTLLATVPAVFTSASVPSLSCSCAHTVSEPPAVPTSNTVLARSEGLRSISWPPVCASPLTTNWPVAAVPLN